LPNPLQLDQHPEVAERFADLHPPLTPQAAIAESNRCLYCFDAPCMAACPTHIDVPRFIKKIAVGNLEGSALSILEANVLASSCSRVCPVSVLCEGACVMQRYNKQPIEIALLQRHAMDAFHDAGGELPLKSQTHSVSKIACIGAGPASLACAAELRQRGFPVTVYEQRALPGGLNTYGVAEYKLRTADSLREIELIRNLGVEFKFGASISNDADFTALEAEYDIIFIGVGLGAMHKLKIPGESHPAVIDALRFIETYKTTGDLIPDISFSPRNVVVVGAGNTAIDAAAAAKRIGAEEVTIVYRRAEPHMSAFDFEYEHAKNEGIRFLWLTQPIAVHAEGDTVRSLECLRVALVDEKPETVHGSNFFVKCDMLIPAIGQSPLIDWLAQCRGIQTESGRVPADPVTGRTTNPKYYAAGDCVNGGREVVDAVAGGKRAGIAIAETLEAAHA
jgi:glutamate synthase (NADPH/NADH) small chain